MTKNDKLKSFVPGVYKDVVEMDTLIQAEQKLFDECSENARGSFEATFIPTATKDNGGLQQYEDLLEIRGTEGETDEKRRDRIYDRWNWKPPYTLKYLKQRLDVIIGPGFIRQNASEVTGEGAYEMYVDYANYALIIESSMKDQTWAHDANYFIQSIKPCNIVYLTRAEAATKQILISEEIYAYQGIYNYKLSLDTTENPWKLGEKPFVTGNTGFRDWNYLMEGFRLGQQPFSSLLEGDLVKLATDPSITQELIHRQCENVSTNIDHVIVNEGEVDELLIESDDFSLNTRVGEDAILIFTVGVEQTPEIHTLHIYSSDDQLLTSSEVVIPIISSCEVKHRIHIEEGVNK